MPRPAKRQGTANGLFRCRIPKDVKAILDRLPPVYRPRGWGKEEITVTLGTADKRKIGAEHARVLSEVTARFAALRAGVRSLSHKEVVALSGLVYRGFAEGGEDDPGPASQWQQALEHTVGARRGMDTPGLAIDPPPAETRATGLRLRFGPMADALCAVEGIVIDDESREALIRELARATDDAASKLLRNAEGDYRPDAAAERFPAWTKPTADAIGSIKLTALFDQWAAHPEQASQARRTIARYRGVFAGLAKFLGEVAAAKVTTEDLQRYFEARMGPSDVPALTPLTAKNVHRAALNSIFAWAVAKRLLAHNPALGVYIKVRRRQQLRPKEARPCGRISAR